MGLAGRFVVVVGALSLPCCGLVLGFDGFSDNYGAEVPLDEDAGKDAASADAVDASPCVPPPGSGAIACDVRIESLAATDTAVLWIAQRGVVVRDLATSGERVVSPRPNTANGSTVTVQNDTIYVGFDTPEPSPVFSCASPCPTLAAMAAEPLARLRKLSASAAGLFAWHEVGGASKLVSVGSSAFHPQTGQTAQIGVTHFVVSDLRAFWRDTDHEKHMCELPGCPVDKSQSTGRAPFRALSGDLGFASAQLGKSGGAAVWICQSDGETCAETQALGIGTDNYNPADGDGIFRNEKAIAVGKDDVVYIGGTDGAGKLQIGKVAGAPGEAYTPLQTLDGAEVTALAVNGADVFVAVVAGGQSLLYRFPR